MAELHAKKATEEAKRIYGDKSASWYDATPDEEALKWDSDMYQMDGYTEYSVEISEIRETLP